MHSACKLSEGLPPQNRQARSRRKMAVHPETGLPGQHSEPRDALLTDLVQEGRLVIKLVYR
jgi:hypothetical protein